MKKQLSSILVIALSAGLIAGCGNTSVDQLLSKSGLEAKPSMNDSWDSEITGSIGKTTQNDLSSQNNQAATDDMNSQSGTINLLTNIKNKYASAAAENANDFNEPVYNVENNHIFTFDCNEEALSSIYYDAFGVYTTIDYDNSDKYIRNCATCEIQNGKLIVRPSVVDKFYDIPESTVTAESNIADAWKVECDGTWGSLNKLYLVQKYDLMTGSKLAKPIITPFSIRHDIESTTLKQRIDSSNNYYLEWAPVTGATGYLVYQIDGEAFWLVYKTTDTKASSDNFGGQLDSDKWADIVNKELRENGYDVSTSEKLFMNSDLHNTKNSKFAVVTIKNGQTSGVSNIVDSNDVADLLPYKVENNGMEITIRNVMDMPTFVNMTTVNDKTMQMLINYHGSTARYENEDSTTFYLYPTVYHTDLSPFRITIHGMPYNEFKAQAQQLGVRQDNIAATMPTDEPDTDINVSNVPNREEEEKYTQQIEKETGRQTEPAPAPEPEVPVEPSEEPVTPEEPEAPSEEPVAPAEPEAPSEEPAAPTEPETPSEEPVAPSEPEAPSEEPTAPTEPEAPSEEPTTPTEPETPSEEPEAPAEPATPGEPGTTVGTGATDELFRKVAYYVEENINKIQQQSGVSLDNVIYADSALEEWLTYCLMARAEYIPVPLSEFPEGADVEGTANKLYAMYKQNPTSGIISNIQYSYDYQTYIINYCDDTEDRLNKTVEEIKKAKEVADSVTSGLSTEYDKVVALNDYFCANAAYDHDSTTDKVEDMNALPMAFIDAHTPYGILCKNYGVCESYAEAMALSGRMAGLNIIIETGDLYGAGGHEWNRVNIDGNWCILDTTNNDNDVVPNGLCNITDGMATQLLIADKTAYLFDAAATTDAYEYYHVNNDYAETISDLTEKIKQQLDSGNAAHVRCDSSITQDDVVAIAQQLYSEGYPIADGYYVYNIATLTK
ncbi:transglutaminase domain-containing protein [Butyrivibrio sp. JL13D10]|uniref:transglutaminase domain-containing protein n=1 Tax=Butyrivibrio sp. JL13D10 TaxID=3236815 RepID=UPI0038B4E263